MNLIDYARLLSPSPSIIFICLRTFANSQLHFRIFGFVVAHPLKIPFKDALSLSTPNLVPVNIRRQRCYFS